jgi:exonuclease SbcD
VAGVWLAELTPAAAWRSCVRLATELGVDAVVLAGDVVDDVDNRFEAAAQLRRGVEDLSQAGIPVVAIAGNHDVEALPRVADQISEFRLVGRQGRWESVRIEGRSGVPVDVWGWSFPRERVDTSPVEAFPLVRAPDVTCLGVLHCDLDGGRSSPYAPVARRDLEAIPTDAWFLGHVHKPHALTGRRPVGYLGSLAGLDPGEPGPHGPWLVEVEGPGSVRASQIPLSPIRWESVAIELAALGGADERDLGDALAAEILRAMRDLHERIAAAGRRPELRVVGCRVTVSGRGRHHASVHRLLLDESAWPQCHVDGVAYFVEKLVEAAAPDLDLASLAQGIDPPGLLARRLLELAADAEPARALRARVLERLGSALARPRWQQLSEPVPSDDEINDRIARTQTRLLDELLEQRAALGPVEREAHADESEQGSASTRDSRGEA